MKFHIQTRSLINYYLDVVLLPFPIHRMVTKSVRKKCIDPHMESDKQEAKRASHLS